MKTFTGILCALLLGLLTAGGVGAATYTYPGTYVPIPEGEVFGVNIEVLDTGTVADINVFVDVTHTCISDLDIYLKYSATDLSEVDWEYLIPSVQLFNQYENEDDIYADDLTKVWFDDEAMNNIDSALPPYGPGSFKPGSTVDEFGTSNLLNTFDGNSIAGFWRLEIYDNYEIDVGTLNAFSIEVTPVPIPGAIWLLGSGIIGLVGIGWKSRS